MKRIELFRASSEEHIIQYMQSINFNPPIALKVDKDSPLKQGAIIKYPTLKHGKVAASRRCLFRFWKKELLVRFIEEVGTFYIWHREEDCRYE